MARKVSVSIEIDAEDREGGDASLRLTSRNGMVEIGIVSRYKTVSVDPKVLYDSIRDVSNMGDIAEGGGGDA